MLNVVSRIETMPNEIRSKDSSARRIAVVGGRGMLGLDLQVSLKQAGLDPVCLDLAEIDITNAESVHSCFEKVVPMLVINCAAYTAVDRAESEPDLAFKVNRDGPTNLADACADRCIPLIQISTDYVFDGQAGRPYTEDDQPNPLGVYGTSKWEGEKSVRNRLSEHLIVRTAWLYGVHGQNFVKTILRLASEREEIGVVADQYGCPTWTVDLAGSLTVLTERILEDRATIAWGTYHFCGTGQTTWHEFARAIVEEGKQHKTLKMRRVNPITTAEYPLPAPRPAYAVLDCRKLSTVFGITPKPWETALKESLVRLLH